MLNQPTPRKHRNLINYAKEHEDGNGVILAHGGQFIVPVSLRLIHKPKCFKKRGFKPNLCCGDLLAKRCFGTNRVDENRISIETRRGIFNKIRATHKEIFWRGTDFAKGATSGASI